MGRIPIVIGGSIFKHEAQQENGSSKNEVRGHEVAKMHHLTDLFAAWFPYTFKKQFDEHLLSFSSHH